MFSPGNVYSSPIGARDYSDVGHLEKIAQAEFVTTALSDIRPKSSWRPSADERILELEAENNILLDRVNELESVARSFMKEASVLRRKVDKYQKQKAARDEEFLKDVQDLERAAMLVSARDTELQIHFEECKKREASYKDRLLLAETSELLNAERIVGLSEDWTRLQNDVSKTMIDKNELYLQELKLKRELVPLSQYTDALNEKEILRGEYDNLYDDLQTAVSERKLLEESLEVLLGDKEKLRQENLELCANILQLKDKIGNSEKDLNELRIRYQNFQNEASDTAEVLLSIREIFLEPPVSIYKTEEAILHPTAATADIFESKVDVARLLMMTQLSSVRLQLRHEKKAKLAVLSQLDKLQEELRDTKTKCEYATDECNEKNEELTEWKSNCLELESKVYELEQDLKRLKENE